MVREIGAGRLQGTVRSWSTGQSAMRKRRPALVALTIQVEALARRPRRGASNSASASRSAASICGRISSASSPASADHLAGRADRGDELDRVVEVVADQDRDVAAAQLDLLEAGVEQDVAGRVGVGHRERAGAAGRLVGLLRLLEVVARRPARRGGASRCRACAARRPCRGGRPGAAPRGRCASPRPGWRRTSSPSARRRSRSGPRTRSPGRRATAKLTFSTPASSASLARLDEARRDVDAERLAPGADQPGDPLGRVAEAAADVEHPLAGLAAGGRRAPPRRGRRAPR